MTKDFPRDLLGHPCLDVISSSSKSHYLQLLQDWSSPPQCKNIHIHVLTICSSRTYSAALDCTHLFAPLVPGIYRNVQNPSTSYAAFIFIFYLNRWPIPALSVQAADAFFTTNQEWTYHARCERACGFFLSWGLTGMKMKHCWWLFWRLPSHRLPPRRPPRPESFRNIPCCWAAQENLVGWRRRLVSTGLGPRHYT